MGKKEEFLALEDDPLWIKDAILYEVHVRAFHDSSGDGVGDFRGLTAKLNYLQELGITTIWLLPFAPSPLKDDGYDTSDYTGVHPAYGTLRDFQLFLKEAHRRGLRVITELVLNHTSDQHPWFQRARRAKPGTDWRDFYVWSDDAEKYREARIIFKDFEPANWTWDPVARAYYWHRFYSHQPDLNFENPHVKQALLQVVDFWLNLGVDGLRLDAVPYLYEREGTNCENLPETHAFLKELRRHVDGKFKDRILLAEANQWPEEAVTYFGNGDECHLAFHFPLMPRLFMALRMEDRFPIIDILDQTPSIPENAQWALFLRNHDELTLEMVTDEERDYMYRVYANDPKARINLGIRRRLAPLLDNNRRKIELMNALLFSLPGTPVIYYGEEIGMGDNIYLGDRNGVRTPMQWSADRNAGFSQANAQSLYLPVVIDPEFHYEAINVEAQQKNPSSLLWWMKRLIALRKRFKAFGRGSLEFLHPENRKVLAFLRRLGNDTILVLANLSRFVQPVQLNLSALKGMKPIEIFGWTEFPAIGEEPYPITLAPHSFYWFALKSEAPSEPMEPAGEPAIPAIAEVKDWQDMLGGKRRQSLESAIAARLPAQGWFQRPGGVKSLSLTEVIPFPDGTESCLALALAESTEGDSMTLLLPLAFSPPARAGQVLEKSRSSAFARIELRGQETGEGIVHDALLDPAFTGAILQAIARRRRFRGHGGELLASPRRLLRRYQEDGSVPEGFPIQKLEKNNSCVIYGDRLVLKLFRNIQEGVNPDFEIGCFLTDEVGFPNVPPLVGSLEYQPAKGERTTLGVLHGFVPNEGDAWEYTLDSLGRYFERVLTGQVQDTPEAVAVPSEPILNLAEKEIPPLAYETIGTYHPMVHLLGRRIAELHLALASRPKEPDFAPEPFTALHQRSHYQSMRNLTGRVLQVLRKRASGLPGSAPEDARKVLGIEGEILKRFWTLHQRKLTGLRIRCHGSLHLKKVLRTGKDVMFIDFKGEPDRLPGERRLKRSPLRDVASMLRSFHYAAYTALHGNPAATRREDLATLEPRARVWNFWVSTVFLKSYFEAAGGSPILPASLEERRDLLYLYYMEKLISELGHELATHPERVIIPLKGILRVFERELKVES